MIATINNINMAYDIRGEGTTLLFLHAFPLNRSMWQPQVEAFSNDYQVISVDYRGFGESKFVDGHYFMELLADDIFALSRHLSLQKFVLVGLSMGGYVAFAFYRKYPQLVQALILADTRAEKDNKQTQNKRKKMAQDAIRRGSEYIADLMTPDLLGAFTQEHNPELVQQVKEIIASNDARAIANAQLGMAARQDSTATLKSIPKPTLLIVGEEDKLTPVHFTEKMQKQIRNSEIVVLPNSGHLANLENPDAFNAAVRKFLRTI